MSEKLLGTADEESPNPPYRREILERNFLPADARPIQAGDLRQLEALRDWYTGLNSIDMVATAKGRVGSSLGQGAYEFRGMDERFRLANWSKGGLGLVQDVEATFDGVRSAIWFKNDDFVSWRSGPAPFVPTAMRNPLFLPVLFLGGEDDGCPTCSLNLVDVQDQSRWAAVLGGIRRGSSPGTWLVPGSLLDGEPFFYRIQVDSDGLVSQLDMVRPNGHVLKAIRLFAYRSAGKGGRVRFPRHIVEEAFSREGEIDSAMHYRITLLREDPEFTPREFRLNLRNAATVIDEDARRLLKHPQLQKKEWARFLQ